VSGCGKRSVGLPLPALRHTPRVMPEDPLQLLGGQTATETSARVLLGSLEKRLAETLVQAGAGGVILVNAAVIHERRVAA